MLDAGKGEIAAAKVLGISQTTISLWIACAAEDSVLGVFKGTFTRGWPPRKVSDDEIVEALSEHGTKKAAAKALGVSPGAISARIAQATEDSALHVFKGTFKRGRRKQDQ